MKLLIIATLTLLPLSAEKKLTRPPITRVAGIGLKVSSLEKAGQFYNGVLGLDEAFTEKNPLGATDLHSYKINEKQYIQIAPDLKSNDEPRLLFIAFETTDAKSLRNYLASKGVQTPAKVSPDPEGNLSFIVDDPDGNHVRFIQYTPKSLHSRNKGKFLSDRRIADHAIHVGMHVKDEEASNRFYRDILDFRLSWKGGPTDERFEWVSMMVPDGNSWVEYMVNPGKPGIGQLGSMNHICLGTLDIKGLHAKVVERGYKGNPPNIARDGRYLLHLFDADRTRTEIMVRKPVEKPCCSPMRDLP